jgi:hypothetical protein
MKRLKGPNHRGVRLYHPSLRNCEFTLEQQSRIYPVPHECPKCSKNHIFKTFHLTLNEHGYATVHEGIYDLFVKENMLGELRAMREVTPRPVIIGLPQIDFSAETLHGPNDASPKPPPLWQPPIVFSKEHGLTKHPTLGNGRPG